MVFVSSSFWSEDDAIVSTEVAGNGRASPTPQKNHRLSRVFGERTTLARATAAKTVEGGRLPAGDEIVKAGPADAARALKRQCNGRLLRPWARNCASKDRALKQHVVAIREPRGLAAGDDVALAVKLGADGAIEKLEAVCEGAPSFYEPFLERTFATRPLLPSFDPERTCVSPTVYWRRDAGLPKGRGALASDGAAGRPRSDRRRGSSSFGLVRRGPPQVPLADDRRRQA